MMNESGIWVPKKDSEIKTKALSGTERVLNYLENKYGEKFSYVGPAGDSMSGIHSFFVACESMPEKRILVEIDNYKEKSELIRDNYLLFKYYDDIYIMLLRELQAQFGDVVLYYLPGVSVPKANLPATASLDELLNDSGIIIAASAEVRASRLKSIEQVENAVRSITSRGCRYYLTFISIEEEQFSLLSNEELSNRASDKNFVHFAELVKGDGGTRATWY